MIGPILAREWLVAPRKIRFYAQRVIFVLALFSLVCTAWALLAGIQQVRNIGDLSRFGLLVFQIVAPLELIITIFLAAVAAASTVAQEKDKRTLILLLLTRLTSTQIVLGKLGSCLLSVISLIFAALPLLLLISLLGGVSVTQVFVATAIILVTTFWCGALANLIAFWREKTFQTLAITLIAIVGWLVFCEVIASGVTPLDPRWAEVLSPVRALWGVCLPIQSDSWLPFPGGIPAVHCVLGSLAGLSFVSIAILRLRVWNPSRQLRPQAPEP
ncbi:MAG: hypothetical protein NXI32_02935, partial [bacterium]|nr:hypothetical protein [bacterium]